jgi:hypothetical protein
MVSFLTHFFADDRSLAKELASNTELLRQSIGRYYGSYKDKQMARYKLQHGNLREGIAALRIALSDEIAMLEAAEDEEKKLTYDLQVFSHKRRGEVFEKLEAAMNHAASQEKFVYHLMKELYNLLRLQAFSVRKIRSKIDTGDLKLTQGLVEVLLEYFAVEDNIIAQMKQVKNLDTLYTGLAYGFRLRYEIQEHEQEFAEGIYERMLETENMEDGSVRPVTDDAVTWLTAHCFNMLEEKVTEAVYEGRIGPHQHAIYEFVNSSQFEDFVIEEAKNNPATGDKNLIRIFIIIFRDFYNHSAIEERMK